MRDPFVVVGGDAAGLSAASKCRREDPEREVIVYEKGRWVSYAHCGTPYYVKGEVDALEDLLSLSPADVADRGIDLRRGHEVIGVDPTARTVTVRRSAGDGVERVEQPYGDLLVATGAHAVVPDLDVGTAAEARERAGPDGPADLDGVFTLHGLDDAAAIRAFLAEPGGPLVPDLDEPALDAQRVERFAELAPPRTAAIVGGGYVGVEMAEALAAHDVAVHLFQRPDRLLPPFGGAAGERAVETLRDRGVTVHVGTAVEAVTGRDGSVTGVVADGERDPAELVVVGVGIAPNTDLLAGTDVTLGASGAVATDRYGRTSVEGVYAAGDCAEMRHAVTGEPAWVPLGLTANRAGRAIGRTVAGEATPVGDVAGTAAVKAFDLECGRSGLLDPGRAADAGFDPVSTTITAGSRSGYYPGAAPTDVTLVADRESHRLLGGAVVGTDRAAVRIDTVATALAAALSVGELERLDLAYAPPFSPVWDPVLVAAKVLHGELQDEAASG